MIKHLTLDKITFPIFPLRNYTEIKVNNNIIEVHTAKAKYILDDKNLPFDTLSKRRLRINKEKRYLLPYAIFNITELLWYKKSQVFIDSKGILFTYVKSRIYNLVCKKIVNVRYVEAVGKVLYIKDIPCSFLVSNTVKNAIVGNWVQLVELSTGYILYNIVLEYKKPTWRKL